MDNRSTLVLLDNGSSRARSTLSLRRIAAALGARVGAQVHPVSLMHADRVPPEELDGRPADTFEPFLRARFSAGERSFVVLPLFFGPSRAVTGSVPEAFARVSAGAPDARLRVAEVLYPVPDGEPRLAAILIDNLRTRADDQGVPVERVVLVDHGSPIPEVSAVRQGLARQLRGLLGDDVRLLEAVMERRPGGRYDFNGELLEQTLRRLAAEDCRRPVLLAMLFMFPGTHAGPEGDVEQICRAVTSDHPGLRVYQSGLVGDHPAIVDVLESRLAAAQEDPD